MDDRADRSSIWLFLSFLLSALSIGLVIKLGIDAGASKAVAALLAFVDQFAVLLLAPLEPLLRSGLASLGVELQLHPHWKYVFLLSMLLCAGPARVAWDLREPIWSLLLYVTGLLASLIGAVVAGMFALPSDGTGGYAFAAIPAFSIVPTIFLGSLFADRRSSYSISRRMLRAALWSASLWATCFGAVLGALQTPAAEGSNLWLLFGIATVPALLALAMLWRAAEKASDIEAGPWWSAFKDDVWARVGWHILSVMFAFLFFTVTNAGLSAYGL